MPEIKPNEVYTTEETQSLLKISNSTVKRLLKRGIIRANKIGGQYRIFGHELLKILSPGIDQKATRKYQSLKQKTKDTINHW